MEAPVVITIAVLALLAVALLLYWINTSNGFKRKKIKIQEALSGIEVALTKRFDMLTKLLDVARGFAAHEKSLFAEVIELRRGMPVEQLSQAAGQLDAMASRINVVAEAYPELRSSEVFRELQAGIRDAEEHLQAARRLYNSNVSAFNQAIAQFPASVVAGSRYTAEPFFEAEAAKREDVKISL